MLSKEDYENYINQILAVEIKMAKAYRECADKIDDPYIKDICEKLIQEEERHANICGELKKLFL